MTTEVCPQAVSQILNEFNDSVTAAINENNIANSTEKAVEVLSSANENALDLSEKNAESCKKTSIVSIIKNYWKVIIAGVLVVVFVLVRKYMKRSVNFPIKNLPNDIMYKHKNVSSPWKTPDNKSMQGSNMNNINVAEKMNKINETNTNMYNHNKKQEDHLYQIRQMQKMQQDMMRQIHNMNQLVQKKTMTPRTVQVEEVKSNDPNFEEI